MITNYVPVKTIVKMRRLRSELGEQVALVNSIGDHIRNSNDYKLKIHLRQEYKSECLKLELIKSELNTLRDSLVHDGYTEEE